MNCVPTSFFPKFRRRLRAPCVVGVCCFASAFLTFVMRTPAQQEKSPLKVVDNGHTITVSYAPGSFITVGDHKYQLLQFHFHRPSEDSSTESTMTWWRTWCTRMPIESSPSLLSC
jgi:hypothetical protein